MFYGKYKLPPFYRLNLETNETKESQSVSPLIDYYLLIQRLEWSKSNPRL